VEEAGAELTVAVPVAGGVQAQAADADDDSHAQDRARLPGTSDHGSTEASHVLILTDPPAHPAKKRLMICRRVLQGPPPNPPTRGTSFRPASRIWRALKDAPTKTL
jgi:hypothetical protein